MKQYLRINGRGNAWPIPLGQVHPFYSDGNVMDYANASFSLMEFREGEKTIENLVWELMIDAGHGAVPFLLKSFNRIPDALFITHPHFDHILGIDWIAQSYYQFHNKQKYPLFSTRQCWEAILSTIPHLENLISFFELKFGIPKEIPFINGLTVRAFPVYHGAHAPGASMLLFESDRQGSAKKKILFTGDVLVPLLSQQDYGILNKLDYLLVDSNNRFPYPGTNHWSIVDEAGFQEKSFFTKWLSDINRDKLLEPHAKSLSYFDFLDDTSFWKNNLCFNVLELVRKIHPKYTIPVHYSGLEDEKYYKEAVLDENGISKWLSDLKRDREVPTSFIVPKTGDYLSI